MVVTPCGPSGLNAARAVTVEQGFEREPAPILPQQEMARDVLIWVNPRRMKSAIKTRALIVSTHTVKLISGPRGSLRLITSNTDIGWGQRKKNGYTNLFTHDLNFSISRMLLKV